MGRKYPIMFEGPDGWSEWRGPTPGYRMACCDCGLVHEMEFRIVQQTGPENSVDGSWPSREPMEKDLRVVFRAKRDKRATAAKRRKK